MFDASLGGGGRVQSLLDAAVGAVVRGVLLVVGEEETTGHRGVIHYWLSWFIIY